MSEPGRGAHGCARVHTHTHIMFGNHICVSSVGPRGGVSEPGRRAHGCARVPEHRQDQHVLLGENT